MQAISLEVGDGVSSGIYPSVVLDFEEGEQLTVGVPLDRGREIRLPVHAPVRIQLTRPDGIHVFASHVVARTSDHPSVVLAWPDTSRRIQRREHVRVGVTLPVHLLVRTTEDAPERTVRALSTDLSAGGIRLVVPEPLAIDTQVLIILNLPESEEHSCEARVLRTGGGPDPQREYPFWVALEFVGMLKSFRTDLTRFVFDVQRDLRRKGLS